MEVEQTGHQIIAALTPNAAGMQEPGMQMKNGMQQPGMQMNKGKHETAMVRKKVNHNAGVCRMMG